MSSPMLWAGFLLFLINRYTDENYNVPILDLALPAISGFYFFRHRAKIPAAVYYVMLPMLAFVSWQIASSFINGSPSLSVARHTIVILTLFVPVYFYCGTTRKQKLLEFMLGCVIGFGLYFAFQATIELLHGSISRTLRGIQPTPVVAIAYLIFFHKRAAFSINLALGIAFLVSLIVTFLIDARGPLLSVVIAGAFWLIARAQWIKAWLLPSAVTLCLMAHFIAGMQGSLYSRVVTSNSNTLSNSERAYAVDYSVAQIKDHPLLGISPDRFPSEFANEFFIVSKFKRAYFAVLSPHNSFLEYSAFYGLPAGFLFLAFIWLLCHFAAKAQAVTTIIMCLAFSAIIRLAAFYGISGWIRIEWFAMVYLLFQDTSLLFKRRKRMTLANRKTRTIQPEA